MPKISGICFLRMPAVVLHADLEAVLAGALDMDPDLRQDAGLFAGVQRVVDGLLDGGQQGLARVVEAQQVAVLGEELADRDVALAGGHRLGGRPATAAGLAVGGRWTRRWKPASAPRGWTVGANSVGGVTVSKLLAPKKIMSAPELAGRLFRSGGL